MQRGKSDKIILFQPRQPPSLGIPSVVFTGSLLMALESTSLLIGDEVRMRTWRRTELLQIHGLTTIRSHSHVGCQTLNDVCHRLVDVLLWQFFPRGSGLQALSTHESS